MIPVLILAGVFLRSTLFSVSATSLCTNDNENILPLPPAPPASIIGQSAFHRLYMVTPLQLDASGKYEGMRIPNDINVCSCVSFMTKGRKKCGSSFVRTTALGGTKVKVHSLNNYVSDQMTSTAESIKQFDAVPGATRRIMKGAIQKLRDYVGTSNERQYVGNTIPEILHVNQSQVNCSFERTSQYYISRTDNGKFAWVFVDDRFVIKTPGQVGIASDIEAAIYDSLTRIVGPRIRDEMVKVELYGENGGTKLEQSMFTA